MMAHPEEERTSDFETLRQALRTGYINHEEHAALDRIEAELARVRALIEKGKFSQVSLRAAIAEGRGIVVTWGMDDLLKELEAALSDPEVK